jgi:hypothetical protein
LLNDSDWSLNIGTLPLPPRFCGFVSRKRNPQAANLEDVKEWVDKLRKATTAGISLSEVTDDVGYGSDADEIEIDDELYDELNANSIKKISCLGNVLTILFLHFCQLQDHLMRIPFSRKNMMIRLLLLLLSLV